MSNPVYQNILDKKTNQQKAFAVLIDPDKLGGVDLQKTIDLAVQFKIDFIFVGGSLVVTDTLDQVVAQIKKACTIPFFDFWKKPRIIDWPTCD
jgi:putative glycerol-1-phosphate prenyltransferase